jgi:hypothetical protein
LKIRGIRVDDESVLIETDDDARRGQLGNACPSAPDEPAERVAVTLITEAPLRPERLNVRPHEGCSTAAR